MATKSTARRAESATSAKSVKAARSVHGERKSGPLIFISYRHAPPTAGIASRLRTALIPAAETWGAEVFLDENEIEPSDLFDQKILAALDRSTHFIVLLTNDYWASSYCRKELARAVERFEKGRHTLLLFVLVEELNPAHFTFANDRVSGRINSDDPVIAKIGDVQFLGPFNSARQLVRLRYENSARLSDQLAQLIKRLGRVMP